MYSLYKAIAIWFLLPCGSNAEMQLSLVPTIRCSSPKEEFVTTYSSAAGFHLEHLKPALMKERKYLLWFSYLERVSSSPVNYIVPRRHSSLLCILFPCSNAAKRLAAGDVDRNTQSPCDRKRRNFGQKLAGSAGVAMKPLQFRPISRASALIVVD